MGERGAQTGGILVKSAHFDSVSHMKRVSLVILLVCFFMTTIYQSPQVFARCVIHSCVCFLLAGRLIGCLFYLYIFNGVERFGNDLLRLLWLAF